jgi:hypothetical protein
MAGESKIARTGAGSRPTANAGATPRPDPGRLTPDLDSNWLTIDNLLQSASDVAAAVAAAGTFQTLFQDLGWNGVASGFALSTSATLTPGLTGGTLYAQGTRYAPGAGPNPGAAPPSSTMYLFYNAATGFYYQSGAVVATPGDALIGQVVTSGTAISAVTQATKLGGQLAVTAPAPGNFTVQHFGGRTPSRLPSIAMTSAGAIWWQSGTQMDGTNLYLVASEAGVKGKVALS